MELSGPSGPPNAQIDRCGIEQRHVFADHSRLFERAHAPQARRRREAHLIRELHIGNTGVLLQVLQDLDVDVVQVYLMLRFTTRDTTDTMVKT